MEPPLWVKAMFSEIGGSCMNCRWQLTISDIEAVGLRGPAHAYESDPLVELTVQCPNCGQRHAFQDRRTLPEVLHAVHWFHEYVLLDLPPEPSGPSRVFDPLLRRARHEQQRKGPGRGGRQLANRPSRRRDSPKTPMTKAEVQQFLRMLGRTSLKRNSKSWARFLERLGTKGRAYDGTDDDPPPEAAGAHSG